MPIHDDAKSFAASAPASDSTIKGTDINSISSAHKMYATDINVMADVSNLAQPCVAVIQQATFKHSPSDFRVDEVMDIDFSGEGEHLWLLIEKKRMNTGYTAQQLARWANIPSRDVGYSGMKDRQAITTQWFSLRLPKKQLPKTKFDAYFEGILKDHETISILKHHWHSKKLNRGTHRANRFEIILRNIVLNTEFTPSTETAIQQINKTVANGVPNYFGNQRFGRGGNNIVAAIQWLEQGTINGRKPHPKKSRDTQSILLSAARSLIFNYILAQRVDDGSWQTGLDGEVFNLAESGSVFSSEQLDDTLKQRLKDFDVHPTAPLWGLQSGKALPQAAALALEQSVVQNNRILRRLAQGLEQHNIKAMRRPLRLIVEDFKIKWLNKDENDLSNETSADILTHSAIDKLTTPYVLKLSFTLPTGAFATSVLASFVDELIEE